MKIENININDLKPYENNPRLNETATQIVKESIKKYGFRIPILIDKNNTIIAGHTRYNASKELKLKEVPCIKIENLTEEQITAYRLIDNKASEYSYWDDKKLYEEIEKLDINEILDFGFELQKEKKEKTESYIQCPCCEYIGEENEFKI